MDVADPRALREVLRRHGVRAATSLGQRFLVDRGVLSAIVEAAELSPDDDVLEVGPGPGVLTAALASRVRSVTAVEVDPRMVALLDETLADRKNVQVVRAGDVDLQFARDEGEGFASVADWREAHERFWSDHEITDETLIVCEHLRVVERLE